MALEDPRRNFLPDNGLKTLLDKNRGKASLWCETSQTRTRLRRGKASSRSQTRRSVGAKPPPRAPPRRGGTQASILAFSGGTLLVGGTGRACGSKKSALPQSAAV